MESIWATIVVGGIYTGGESGLSQGYKPHVNVDTNSYVHYIMYIHMYT